MSWCSGPLTGELTSSATGAQKKAAADGTATTTSERASGVEASYKTRRTGKKAQNMQDQTAAMVYT